MERGEIAPQEQFLLFSTIFCILILDFYVKTRTRFSLRDKRLFEITEVEITKVDCILFAGFICDRALDPLVYVKFYLGEEARGRLLHIEGITEWLQR